MYCKSCGIENDNTSKFCSECGTSFTVASNENFSLRTEEINEADIRLFVGEKYEQYFKRKWFKGGQYGHLKRTSFNFAGLIFSTLWLVYRGMYGYAFALTAIQWILIEVYEKYGKNELFLFILPAIVVAMSGNQLYYDRVIKKIKSIKSISNDANIINHQLLGAKKTSAWAVFWFLCLLITMSGIIELLKT